MIPTNPLTHIHVDRFAGFPEPAGAAGEEEIDRRVQELVNEWIEFYFSGNVFQTPDSPTTTIGRTFVECEVIWDQASMPNPLTKPVLHLILADRRDGDPVQVEKNLWRVQSRFTWNALIRVSPQLPVAGVGDTEEKATLNAGRLCRKVGDQARWLLNSAHTQELAVKGIGHLTVDDGPRQMPGGPWQIRQLIFSAEVVYHQRSNQP